MIKEPKCKNCYDKGYSTQFRGEYYCADFVGERTIEVLPRVHINFCKCAKGKRLKYKGEQELLKRLGETK